MAKSKKSDDAPVLKSVTTAPAEGEVNEVQTSDVKFVKSKPFDLVVRPKTSPRYDWLVTIGLDLTDHEYEVVATDGADAVRKVLDHNEGLKAAISRLRRNAKRLSWIPVNVEQLTVEQVQKLNGLTPEQKAELAPKAIQPETTEVEVETLTEETKAA